MKALEKFVNEKLKVSKDVVTDEITYETLLEELIIPDVGLAPLILTNLQFLIVTSDAPLILINESKENKSK